MSKSTFRLCGCGCGISRRTLFSGAAGIGASIASNANAQIDSGNQVARIPELQGPKIDAHMHLQCPAWFSSPIFPSAPAQIRRRTLPAPPGVQLKGAFSLERDTAQQPTRREYGSSFAEHTQRILDEMDAAGIDTAILYAMDYDYTNAKLNVTHWDQLEALAGVRDKYPDRFVLFAAMDPRRGRAGVEMLRRAARDLKIIGMGELAPHFFGFAPNDRERCYPYYEVCAELGLHIAPNCSIISSRVSHWCDPIYFEDVAHDFPQINICLTSSGIPHWIDTAMALAQSKQNIFIDTADWQSRRSTDPVADVLAYVRKALDSDARHKIMFGSDHPVYARTVSQRSFVEVFTIEAAKRGVNFSAEDLYLFFTGNAQEFINLDIPPRTRVS